MLNDLVPPVVHAVESFEDLDIELFAEEAAAITNAVDKRRREFATSRACARAALRRLGIPPAPIVPGLRGAPGWPPGVVGSMTHCEGYRAAALAREADVLTVGIDAEPDGPLPDGVLEAIALDTEQAMLRLLPEGPHWDRLLFSAKESVYKAWFPLALTWLDFSEARITLSPDGTFDARLLVPGPLGLTGFDGRWLAADGLVLTAIAVIR